MKKLLLILFLFFSNDFCEDFVGSFSKITDELLQCMSYSWQEKSPVPLEDLRYLKINHWGFDGKVHEGEIVVHTLVAEEVVEIFRELFKERFPISRMKLVDEFEGDDDRSMATNNCYAHCTRSVTNMTYWSNHAYGLAIDINPQQNPFVRGDYVCPSRAKKAGYLYRADIRPGMIASETSIYKIFVDRGWQWGGECFAEDGYHDLHHFQKIIPGLNNRVNGQ